MSIPLWILRRFEFFVALERRAAEADNIDLKYWDLHLRHTLLTEENFRLTGLMAALARVQSERLDAIEAALNKPIVPSGYVQEPAVQLPKVNVFSDIARRKRASFEEDVRSYLDGSREPATVT